MTKREYFHKRIDRDKDKKRLASFEQGKSYGDHYNFLKMLKENDMTWEEHQGGIGVITHKPTGLTIKMGISPHTRTQHKCYHLDKLKDKVSNYLYKMEMSNTPFNTLI